MFIPHGNIEGELSFELGRVCPTHNAHVAAACGNSGDLYEILLAHPGAINESVNLWGTPLHYAIYHGHFDIILDFFLLNPLATSFLCDRNCATSLCLAIWQKNFKQ